MEEVSKRDIALANLKVGHDRTNGFVGTAVKADDPMSCTEYDRLVILGWDGVFKVIPVPDKLYVGSVCAIYKADREQVYSMIYRERKSRICFAKRFKVDSYIMDKEYKAIPKGCKVEKVFDRYGVILQAEFEPMKGAKINQIEIDFEAFPLRGATARGLKVHAKKITKLIQLKRGTEVNPNAPNATVDDSDDEPEFETPQLIQPGMDEVAVSPALRARLAHEKSQQAATGTGKSAGNTKPAKAKKAKPAKAAKAAESSAPSEPVPRQKPAAGKTAVRLTPGVDRTSDSPAKPKKPDTSAKKPAKSPPKSKGKGKAKSDDERFNDFDFG
jgi:topoisomerase-4 subunit A